jgi:subtilisin family serine protease
MTPGDSNSAAEDRLVAPTPRRGAPRRDHLNRSDRPARFLDPEGAVRFEGQQLAPTTYAGDQLLMRPTGDDDRVVQMLTQAADEEGYDAELEPVDTELVEIAEDAGILGGDDQPLVVRVHLHRRYGERALPAADAWPVLQRYRELAGNDPRRHAVQLVHLLTTAAKGIKPAPYVAHGVGTNPYVAHGVGANPYVAHAFATNPYIAHALGGNPYVAHPYVAHGGSDPYSPQPPTANAEYAQPGWGGRMPVLWVGPRPTRRRDRDLGGARRPVVAVLDTGTGKHPWLTKKIVDRTPTCGHLRIGLTNPDTDIERTGVVTGAMTGSLDIQAGHGTFIAGLVHQRCPDARILSIRVVQPDGVVSEYDLLQALNMLWVRQAAALRHQRREELIDVISISLGYYHEQPSDALFDPLMLTPLRALGRLGVAVVVSAGNDATSRPLYPAAFAPHRGGVVEQMSPGEVPLVAVGATNPDGTVALFSNDGPWVRAHRPGAGLVSTVPTTFDAGRKPTVQVVENGQVRSTIDPDNFLSGFASWSGTSFAAPILAGDIAQCMNEKRALRQDPAEPENAVETAWRALRRTVPELKDSP